ncbi:MAG: TonB family protein [Burkholderiaceae bacterium]|jgi:protein TonB|nr:TonB family protein [Burkholderiales bacterium]MCE2646781.1 TonB family protein [Burkholderiaceae bacterium]
MAQRSVTAIGSGGQIGELGRESKYNRGFFMTSGDAMDFSRSARDPRRHYIGIGSVIVLHLLIVWALVSGLARKVIEVVKGPIEVKVIEEVAKPPPPPPEVLPPPPKVAAPPPPFVPPPEIQIANPPPAPTITAVTPVAPPGPQAPVIQKPVETAPAAPPAPAIRQASVVCPNYREVMGSITYPREALLENLEGEVVIEFTVAANGQIRDPVIRSSTNRIFNRPSLSVVQSRLQCQGQGQDVRVQAPIVFKIR